MKIAIAGGSGLVGKALVTELTNNGDEVVILTRGDKKAAPGSQVQYIQWLVNGSHPVDQLQDVDVFVNLAGESLNSGRWTAQRKERILGSRLQAVDELLKIISMMERKPQALINASAIGYYGTSEYETFTESSSAGNDFLAQTVRQWEQKAHEAENLGLRTVLCRFGVILDQHGGALAKMTTPYQAFVGGTIGTGRQWMSWIHIADVVKAILFVIENKQIKGPVNFTAPRPVQMKEFGHTLGKALHRPHWLPVPGFALKLLLGEMSVLVLEGQKVLPQQLVDHGFQFQFPHLSDALADIFS